MSAHAAGPCEALVGRCYTRARRHQNVVGRWPGGGRIPGGPYTWPQIVVAVAALGLLVATRSVWAHHGLVDLVPLIGVPGALALGVRRISVDGRNPFAVAASALGLAVVGGRGRIEGRPVRAGRRGALVGVCTVTWTGTDTAPAAPAPGPAPASASASASAAAAAGRPRQERATPRTNRGFETARRSAPPAAAPTGAPVMSGVGALLTARPRAASNENEFDGGVQ
ncbi:hypothetical protein ACFXPZ_17995 [Streptomyces sp. NPDC059101]|uniref:hypothetical protein n=1 Tax=Streptomyces sp. NPDC059101 TaxID=3346728 RepID=UPI00368D6F77